MKHGIFILLFIAMLLTAAAALGLELTADPIVPFSENRILVRSDTAGTLTITPCLPDFDLMDAVNSFPVEAGETEILWDGLSWYGEPVPAGRLTLRARLADASGAVTETSLQIRIKDPLCTAVLCLPFADSFCPSDGDLRVDCGLSRKGTVVLTVASADEPDRVLRTLRQTASGSVPVTLKWDGRDQQGHLLPPGEYLLTAASEALPDRRVTAPVTLEDTPSAPLNVFVTRDLFPADPEDDQQVWAALTAPAVVGAGTEGQGLYLMKKKKYAPGGSISCRTVAVRVLETGEDGWCKVAAWRQAVGEYMEGYVKQDKLTVIAPRQHYGVLISKQAQTLTVYRDGMRLGSLPVSTGLLSADQPLAATPPGVYLIGSRMKAFQNDGFHYDYPIRLHGSYLLHTVGWKLRDSARSYAKELADLGSPASHGCIRMDVRPGADGGLNAWWIWTHLGRDTRVIVTE